MKLVYIIGLLLASQACNSQNGPSKRQAARDDVKAVSLTAPAGKAIAAFAEGCFWCVEEVFEAVPGVDSVISGYAGGTTPRPTYQTVGSGQTDHAESVLVYYDPKAVSYAELVNVFFASHDPTTRNRQGPDAGPQYRSILFYATDTEKKQAETAKAALQKARTFKRPVVSEIAPLKAFYKAEAYHQDYIHRNPGDSYVVAVSVPRFEQFKRTYPGKLKSGAAQ